MNEPLDSRRLSRPETQSRVARGEVLARIALVVSGVAAALVLIELGLRIAGWSNGVHYHADPKLGWSLRAGVSGWDRDEVTRWIAINSQGLRDREHSLAKPRGTHRIAVLGDSFAAAFAVTVEEAFWSVMAERLSRCDAVGGAAIEPINFGVPSYGTAQQLLLLRERVWAYDPDVVLLAFYAGNDVRDNSAALSLYPERPFFTADGGRLTLDATFDRDITSRLRSVLGPLYYALLDHARMLQAVKHARQHVRQREALAKAARDVGSEHASMFVEPDEPSWKAAWAATETLLVTLRDEVAARGKRFVLATVSIDIQVHPDDRLRTAYRGGLNVRDLWYPERRLSALAERHGLEIVTLAPPLLERVERNGIALHGFPDTQLGDGHWNAHGHRAAGELLADYLCSHRAGRTA